MDQNYFSHILLCIVPLSMFGLAAMGIILLHRVRRRSCKVRYGLRLFVFIVALLYLLLFTVIALWCAGWFFDFYSMIWNMVWVGGLLLVEVGILSWYAYRCIIPAGIAGPGNHMEAVAGQENSENFQETTEERICRGLSKLFDEQHIYREFELHIEDVAIRIGTNRTYLSAVLNRKFGYNFLRFVNQYRLDEASELLKSTSWPVRRIADQVGYKNINTFNSCFRERFGLPPRQWRLNNMES